MGDAICMSQYIPQSGQDLLSLPDFHDDGDLFDDGDTALVAHPRRRRVLILLSIILLAVLIIGGVWFIKYRTHVVYQTKKVVQNDLVITVNAAGSLHTNIYTVNFMGSGVLAAINVAVGQHVSKDQILATIDPTSLQNALNEAQGNVAVAQTVLDNANANYAVILAAYQTSKAPSTISISGNGASHADATSDVSPTVTPETNVVQVTEALGQIKLAQKALALAQAEVDTAKYNLNNTILKAPHAGTIAMLNGTVGAEPDATFIQIVDLSALQLQANVKEANIGAIVVGDAVSFSVDAYPGQSFNGNVVTISPLGQLNSGVVTYPVWITLLSAVPASIHLLPEMTVSAAIVTQERTGVLLVPASALAFAQTAPANLSSIDHAQIHAAFNKANAMAQNQQQDVSQENPLPAVVLERSVYDKIVAIPIVVGLTNGSEYEVLDGLSVNAVVLVGAQTSSN
jgi:HlyD family secretion protein